MQAFCPVGNGICSPGMKRRTVKLTTHLHPELKMDGDMLPLPHTSSSRGAYLSVKTVLSLRTPVE